MISGRLDGAIKSYDAFLERVRREFSDHQDLGRAARDIQNRLAELAKAHEVDPGEILAGQAMLVKVSWR